MDTHGRIKIGTITTANLDAAVSAYTDFLDQEMVEDGEISPALAQSWGTDKMAGAQYVLLAPKSGAHVFIRLIEQASVTDVKPLGSLGWSALELTIDDTDSLYERLKNGSPFRIIGPPQYLEFGDAFYPMQVSGPAGEVLYLNKVKADIDQYDLPKAKSSVDYIFIAVLAAHNIDETTSFYTSEIGWENGPQFEVCVPILNGPLGVAPEYKLRLAMTGVGRMVNMEVDEFPPHIGRRDVYRGELPGGIAIISYMTKGFENLRPLGPIMRHQGLAYAGRRSATFQGPSGELVELIEMEG